MPIRRKRKNKKKKVGGLGPILAGLIPAVLGTFMTGAFGKAIYDQEQRYKRRGLGRKR
jgi:uncharacterized membrane protein YeaQ/YmgE (transglycosylase-associated protein family)